MEERWKQVDEYFAAHLLPNDPILSEVLSTAREEQLPAYNVTQLQGAFLQLVVRMTRAKRILEIGTLAGYSTIWMARGLEGDGKIVTVEYDPKHAEVARNNFRKANVEDVVELREGSALEVLSDLREQRVPPFDVVFIDADKQSNPLYLEESLELSKPGTVIIGDNVVRNGSITDPSDESASGEGVRRFIEMLGNDERLVSTAMQTVGSKGYDGFSISIVR